MLTLYRTVIRKAAVQSFVSEGLFSTLHESGIVILDPITV